MSDLAPDFALTDAKKRKLRLRDLMGREGLLLVFYRGSFCPYCVGQLAALNHYSKRLGEAGTQIAAISVDSTAENKKLVDQLGLTFPVLSDPDGSVIRLYGVAEEKVGASYPQGVAKASLFLIDKQGKIRHKHVSRDFLDRPPTGELVKLVEGFAPVKT